MSGKYAQVILKDKHFSDIKTCQIHYQKKKLHTSIYFMIIDAINIFKNFSKTNPKIYKNDNSSCHVF